MDGEKKDPRGRKKLPDSLHGKNFTISFPGRLARQVEFAAALAGLPVSRWIREKIKVVLKEENFS